MRGIIGRRKVSAGKHRNKEIFYNNLLGFSKQKRHFKFIKSLLSKRKKAFTDTFFSWHWALQAEQKPLTVYGGGQA